ncbi:MAG: diaminopimelate decarboxylase [Clostridiales Family XIII bacterium]|jgi:diaminopimelate decarboxylase|nr:diaminopimelate decarboxylase [Clostridiales Family XIII bacterium]
MAFFTDNKNDKNIFSVRDGVLYIEGVSALSLAEEYGTPLYVYSKRSIKDRCREIKEDFLDRYPGTEASYAAKAFLTPAIAELIDGEGLMLDVVSGGELFVALAGGFPASKIKFHGNNKTREELEYALRSGVGRIVIDALDEIDLLEEAAKRLGKVQKVLFRITPEVKAGAHDHITTGQRNSKFGIPMDGHIIFPLIEKSLKSENIILSGLHFHLGSQLFEDAPFLEALGKALDLVLAVRDRYGYTMPELNVGGGYGVHYVDGEERKPYSYFVDPIMKKVDEYCASNDMAAPVVGIEPGRSVVGEAGVTLYRIGSVKKIPEGKTFVSVDGGISDNIRHALYDAEYEAVIANKAGDLPSVRAVVCGKLCEEGDRIISDALIAEPERADVLCVFTTGAYCYSMASNYNKMTKPAVVLVDGEASEVLVKRQEYKDYLSTER